MIGLLGLYVKANLDHEHYQPDEDVLHKLNDDLTPDGILEFEDKTEDNLEPINKKFEGFEQEAERDANNILGDIYPDDK